MPPLLPLLLSYGLSPLPAVVPKPITGRVLVVGHGKSRAGGPERSVPKPPCPPWSRPGAEQPIEHGNWLCQGDQLGFQFCKNHPRARPSLPRGDSVNDARRAAPSSARAAQARRTTAHFPSMKRDILRCPACHAGCPVWPVPQISAAVGRRRRVRVHARRLQDGWRNACSTATSPMHGTF